VISVGNGSDAVIERNTFDSNAVIGGVGGLDADGGVGNGGGVSGAGFATLELERNKFIENSAQGGSGGGGDGQDATGRGGGLGLDSISLAGFAPGTATASSESDTFQGNIAYGGIGGGIYNEGELTLEKSKLKDNKAIGLPDVGIDFVPGYTFVGAALGGGISNIGSLEMSKVNFESNQAIGANGAFGGPAVPQGGLVFLGVLDGTLLISLYLGVRYGSSEMGRWLGILMMTSLYGGFAMKWVGVWQVAIGNAAIGVLLSFLFLPGKVEEESEDQNEC
jgi:hypothetical protein